VDKILAPTGIIDTGRRGPEPKEVSWNRVTDQMLEEVPVPEKSGKSAEKLVLLIFPLETYSFQMGT
jgi:hypothetical protein